ncbi:MAG: sulfatase-like hydrolase/transferase [Candidatus Eisenbacteria bacterium]|nr:sulfatase-like hydrolase/transferase [Candidatus Eisenbacteria bacterium]
MRKLFIAAAAAALLIILLAGWRILRSGAGGNRPHVVLIMIDTLRADYLGCYGHDRDISPEIDVMAGDGVRFEQAIAQCSWTRPSVGSFLTSWYPRTLGIHFEDRGILPGQVTTLAEVLQAAGYRTLGATANPHLNPIFNFHQGFDYYLDTIHVFHWMDDALGQVPEAHPPLPAGRDLFGKVLEALRYEEADHRDKPHYLQFNIMEVHETWGQNDLVRPEFKGLYPDVSYMRKRRYLQAVRQVSRDIDWFVHELRALPGWDDVLVVLLSDHGEGLDSHPSIPRSEGHGSLLYESQIRVPWILFRPGDVRLAGRVIKRPVRLLDLMPTLLDMLKIPPPEGMRGVSLIPLLEGGTVEPPERFVVETHYRGTYKMGVYTDDWKLFHNRDEHPGLNPVALHRVGVMEDGVRTDQGDAFPGVVQELSRYLEAWERANPAAHPVPADREMSPETLEQLRSLGYIQ